MAEANNQGGVPKSEQIARQLENMQNTATGQPVPTTSGAQAQPERKYVGKFSSPDDLERGYRELEAKLGKPNSKLGSILLERVMRNNPGLTEEQAAALLEQELTKEEEQAEEPKNDLRVARNPYVDKAVNYYQQKEFLEKHPDAEALIDTLKDLQSTPRFKFKTLSEIYEESPNLQGLIPRQDRQPSITAAGSAPSEISDGRIPSREEMREMARREGTSVTEVMARYLKVANTAY